MFSKKFAFVLMLALSTLAFADEYFEYPQKVDGCYQISTGQEMNGFIRIVNGSGDYPKDPMACGVLTADIRLVTGEFGWDPIEVFSGTFDGNGHTISNLEATEKKPFFTLIDGTKDKPAVIKNVGWVNSSVSSQWGYIGLIRQAEGYVLLDNVYNSVDYTASQGLVSCFILTQ